MQFIRGKESRSDFTSKIVLLRLDLNVPLTSKQRSSVKKCSTKFKISDIRKIKESIPTIKLLLKKKCRIIIITHLGEPKGVDLNLSTKILLEPLTYLVKRKVIFSSLSNLDKTVSGSNEIILLENIRFDPRETANDITLARELAQHGDIYVNDAFAVCHRAHASVALLPTLLPSYGGLLLEKEVTTLSSVLTSRVGSVWVIGGAKLSKLDVILNALSHAEHVLLGGALCLPFVHSSGSDLETKKVVTKLRKNVKFSKIVLPVDFKCLDKNTRKVRTILTGDIDSSVLVYDIGPATIKLFSHHVSSAKTVMWNGPLGYFEKKPFHLGTKKVLGSISPGCVAVCGGGETSEAVTVLGLGKKFSHVSTGGGASLAFLSGEKMPGITALEKSKK